MEKSNVGHNRDYTLVYTLHNKSMNPGFRYHTVCMYAGLFTYRKPEICSTLILCEFAPSKLFKMLCISNLYKSTQV